MPRDPHRTWIRYSTKLLTHAELIEDWNESIRYSDRYWTGGLPLEWDDESDSLYTAHWHAPRLTDGGGVDLE